ncbi:MAG: hypothetical protein WC838_03225, partial [Candidatus Margulisiibacteriota bacterium]
GGFTFATKASDSDPAGTAWNLAANAKMVITNAGNVGIGTTTPIGVGTGPVLHIAGSQRSQLILDNTGTTPRKWHLASFGDAAGIFAISDLTAAQTPTRLAIDTNGNVGIGMTAPWNPLHVKSPTVNTQT